MMQRKKAIFLFLLGLFIVDSSVFAQFPYIRKTKAQLDKMTPEQHVEEYLKYEELHGDDPEYRSIMRRYIVEDGIKTLPAVTKAINSYKPAKRINVFNRRQAIRFDMASDLLNYLGEKKWLKVKEQPEGKQAIEALKKAIERMRAIGIKDDLETQYEVRSLYNISLVRLKSLEGEDGKDKRE